MCNLIMLFIHSSSDPAEEIINELKTKALLNSSSKKYPYM